MKNTVPKGFTIVELVIVIVVIGILAGVTLLGYSTWRQNMATTTVKSDLQQVAAAMEGTGGLDGTYPTSIPPTFTPSKDVTVTYATGDSTKYCVQAVSNKVSSVQYYVDSSTGKTPVAGVCTLPSNVPANPSMTWAYVSTKAQATATTTCTSGSPMYMFTSSTGAYAAHPPDWSSSTWQSSNQSPLYTVPTAGLYADTYLWMYAKAYCVVGGTTYYSASYGTTWVYVPCFGGSCVH